MTYKFRSTLLAGSAIFALLAVGDARATEGYFVQGVSAREQALGGAGSALPDDALTNANNPAGLVDVGHQLTGGVSLFNPNRRVNASGTVLVAPGSYSSSRDIFAIPSFGYSRPLDADRAIGVSVVANGGMDTSYSGNIAHAACALLGSARQGVFCGGRAGVDLNQGLISLGYAQRFGNLSLGVAPVVAVQAFSAYGLSAFTPYSSNGAALTDRGPSWSVGAGLRVGALYKVNEQFNIAVTGATPIWTTSLSGYTGLFADGGNFDVPAVVGAGLAYKILPTLAVLVDYKHIFYSSVNSVGNAMAPIGIGLLGTSGGSGFGWRDIDVVALGVEWRPSNKLTLRAGYAHNTQPITSANVMFNILAPAVITDHVSGGFSYRVTPASSVDFALVYAPHAGVSGQEYLPPPFGGVYNPASNVNISMSQLQVTLGYTYRFEPTQSTVIAKY
ncbi:hypothetical protein CCR94_10655 [Rhodoblastus sphagnicola]|uniref:Hydrocarbon degradation protein n=1 Tax=Rhodoblastus sphagnicola TaxID=333368 RepID=A0A2S6N8J7_9HYPH|nr:outer membrane protein transport protein [Rhodoblastus sphagnicola]MBB4199909.1 long-chain fatty acid transport protein [Rhodoblastus sphagnicola]PPQ30934.1 hypothetical protein CCR94_10655 [Rhodoblastus sphagnicola]